VKLELHDSSGELVSENFYWLGADSASYRRLNRLPTGSLSVTARSSKVGDNVRVQVQMSNIGTVASLFDKLTLLNASDASRILPPTTPTTMFPFCLERNGKSKSSIPRSPPVARRS